jgi:ankyrin repeat protein
MLKIKRHNNGHTQDELVLTIIRFKATIILIQLAIAARDGDDARVAALIDRGASCDAVHALGDPDGAGRSAVYWAARGGHLSTFRLLKSRGADVHTAAANGVTPFMAACGIGGSMIARELKDAGADLNATANQRRAPRSPERPP